MTAYWQPWGFLRRPEQPLEFSLQLRFAEGRLYVHPIHLRLMILVSL